jgi:hypothetical protein
MDDGAMVGLEKRGMMEWETRMHCGDVRIPSLPSGTSGTSLREVLRVSKCICQFDMCWLHVQVHVVSRQASMKSAMYTEYGTFYWWHLQNSWFISLMIKACNGIPDQSYWPR